MSWRMGGTGRDSRSGTRPTGRPLARSAGSLALLVVAGIVLSSCGGESQPLPPVTVSPTPVIEDPTISVSTPRASATAMIGEVVWAARIDPTTNAPIELATSYSADAPRITAVASAESLPAGLPVEAKWEYNNTSLDTLSTQLMSHEMVAQTWITFHIEREPNTPWPVGVYEVSISLNGTEMQHATVEVTG